MPRTVTGEPEYYVWIYHLVDILQFQVGNLIFLAQHPNLKAKYQKSDRQNFYFGSWIHAYQILALCDFPSLSYKRFKKIPFPRPKLPR